MFAKGRQSAVDELVRSVVGDDDSSRASKTSDGGVPESGADDRIGEYQRLRTAAAEDIHNAVHVLLNEEGGKKTTEGGGD